MPQDSAHNAVTTKHEKAKPNPLELDTKQTLLTKARAKKIPNRSTMNKADLIHALRNLKR